VSCLSAAFNVAAAALTLIGSAMAATGGWLAPDPTLLTKVAAAGLTVAAIGAAAWFIAALLELLDCWKKSGVPDDEIKELEDELRKLQEKIERLENQ
jgi:hypothetical protein